MKTNNKSGVILVTVVCFTAIIAILALGLWSESSSQLKLAERQVRLEQAFYIAEGGAERAVSCIRNSGGNPPGVITGSIGNGTYSVAINSFDVGGQTWYTVSSTGEVYGVKKNVIVSGVRQQSWARFAMWFDHSGGPIYFTANEVMNGPVHANCPLYLLGNPTFNALVTSSADDWGQWSASAVFNQGFQLGVPPESMANINFSNLLSNASLVITGVSSITMSETNVLITNPQRGWTTNNYPLTSSNNLIYVRTDGTNAGTVNVGGTNLDGRLTIVADHDINITNHIGYAVHPTNNSDDALGLVAQNDVVVKTTAPNNVNIFAHIISGNLTTNYSAGFYVENLWDSPRRPASGTITVYGGIVENNRGAVGVGSYGFQAKNYTYDTRFENDPPPLYPTVTNAYVWSNWRETTVQ